MGAHRPAFLFWVCVVLWVPTLGWATPQQIAAIKTAENLGGAEVIRAQLAEIIGQPATDVRVAWVVRTLEARYGLGGLDTQCTPRPDGRCTLVITGEKTQSRVARLTLTRAASSEPSGATLRKQIEARTGPLHLTPGRVFHPALLVMDLATIRRHFQALGHRDVVVSAAITAGSGLHEVRFKINGGPRYHVSTLKVTGSSLKGDALVDLQRGLPLRARSRLDAVRIAAAVQAIQDAECWRGYAQAKVEVEEEDTGDKVALRFVVTPGTRRTLAAVRYRGAERPIIVGLPVAGQPYCPGRADEATLRLKAYYQNRGRPESQVSWHARSADGDTVELVFTLEPGQPLVVDRIWFEGHKVTDEALLEGLLTVKPGQPYRQSDIDLTVQALRRTGLFRRVSVKTVRGPGDGIYLYFVVVERPLVSLGVSDRSVTFRNVDVFRLPEWQDFDAGTAFRGGGQSLTLVADDGRQAVRWSSGFVLPRVMVDVLVERRTSEVDALDETWYAAMLNLGVRFWEGRLVTLVSAGAELSDTAWPEAVTELPVWSGSATTYVLGVEVNIDFTRLDEERVKYMGVDGQAQVLKYGGDLAWIRYDTALRIHIPVGRNARGQHYVLRLGGRTSWLDLSRDNIPPHALLVPTARGYSGSAVTIDLETEAGRVRVGGEWAYEGTAELRIPIPLGRRNALLPFFDVAGLEDPDGEVDTHYSLGASLAFSLFDEQLEGRVHAAVPLRDETDTSYVGASLGGSF